MIKCEHSWSNRNAVLTGIVLIMMLFLSAETSYASIEERVTLKGFTYSYYSDGQAPEYNQHGEFEGSLGNPVYCGNHGLPSPTGNTVGDSKSFAIYEYDNEIVEKILYYGYRGPCEWEGFSQKTHNDVYKAATPEGKRRWCGIALTGMALTKSQERGYMYDISGFKEFWEYVSNAPATPKGFQAYIMYGNNKQQNLFTWTYTDTTVEIIKCFEADGVKVPLEGAILTLVDVNGIEVERWKSSKEPYVIKGISPGKYILREVTSPKGYAIAEDMEIIIEDVKTTQTFYMENHPQEIRLILKKDLERDPFGILKPSDLGEIEFGIFDSSDVLIDRFKVDDAGIGVYEGKLIEGQYYLKEIKGVDGYEISTEKYYFEVCYDDSGKDAIEISVNNGEEIINPFIKCKIHITKVDKNSGEPLENVAFRLYDSNGIEIATGYTNVQGKLEFGNLPIGEYYLKEIESSIGYEVDDSIHQIVLTEESTIKNVYLRNRKIVIPLTGHKESYIYNFSAIYLAFLGACLLLNLVKKYQKKS